MATSLHVSPVSADEAVSIVKSGDKVFIHGASATPSPLVEALCRRTDLENVTLYHLHTTGRGEFTEPQHAGRFFSVSLFTGHTMRGPIAEGRADFMPIFLSDIPSLFTSGAVPLDVALVQLSTPNRTSTARSGTSVDAALAAAWHAKAVVAEVNAQMPRTLGQLGAAARQGEGLHPHGPAARRAWRRARRARSRPASESIIANARRRRRVPADGHRRDPRRGARAARQQARPGRAHRDVQRRADSARRERRRHQQAQEGARGPQRRLVRHGHPKKLFDFVNDNQQVEFHPCDRTNDTALIGKNDKVVAINSAIEVDLTGQVCADSMGHRIYSGIGGQMDFIRGAARSAGGKPIIALPSTAARAAR
jgi:4-hydroxybutyrate CoA-transferase